MIPQAKIHDADPTPRSSRSQTSASASRTARRTRWSSSRGSTTARRSPARASPSSGSTTACSGGAPPAPTASRWRPTRRCATATGGSSPSSSRQRRTATRPTSGATGTKGCTVGLRYALQPPGGRPLLRGTVFTDRGVYRLGEEMHFKAVLRENSAAGIRLLPAGTPVLLSVRDSQDRVVDERTVKLTAWSSAEWTMTLPQEGSLGNYSVRAILERDKPKPKKPEALRPGDEPGPDNDEFVQYQKRVHASFLVAAYRRPDFRVDVALTGTPALAGSPLNGAVNARYLFGAADGIAAGLVDVLAVASLRRAGCHQREVSGRAVGVRRLHIRRAGPEPGNGAVPGDDADQGRHAAAEAGDGRERRQGLAVRARRRCRGRLASAHREPRGDDGAPRAVVRRRRNGCRISPSRRTA